MFVLDLLLTPAGGKCRAGVGGCVSACDDTRPQAQTYDVLYSFTGTADGAEPFAKLVHATNGNLYGTTLMGGASGYGSIFQITTSGTLTKLHTFGKTDGAYPAAGLIQASDGNLYGTTNQGGSKGYGTVFKITSAGTFTSLHSFTNKDGAYPSAELVQANDGNLYGTTTRGGTHSFGTVFKITTAGTLTSIHSFYNAPVAGLIQATDGNLYGTASGGDLNDGTVFKMTLAGAITILHTFDFTDGNSPQAKLVQGKDGNFYGTTSGGGANNGGTVFTIAGGTFASLYSFCSQPTCDDGSLPSALIQATDGNLYGVTYREGTKGSGTIFQITTAGVLTTEYSFSGNGTDGDYAIGALLQDTTNGDFYGTASGGGANDDGTVFSLSLGLERSVAALEK